MSPAFLLTLWLGLIASPYTTNEARSDHAVPLTAEVKRYEPYSRGTPADLGRLGLSRDLAKFSALKGTMHLRYAALRAADSIQDDAAGDVYEVTNATQFANLNKRFSKDCGSPVRWLVLTPTDHNGLIRIWFLTTPDWRNYRSTILGICRGDTFYSN